MTLVTATALRRPRLAMIAAFGILMALVLPLTLSAYAAARGPQPGDYFEYDYVMTVDQGTGAYEGYTERTDSHYRYSVVSVSGDTVTMVGTGSWTYSNNTGGYLSGSDTYHPVFSTSTRQYLSGVDVNTTVPNPYVWFWISTPASEGQVVPVLDENLTVTSLSSTVWLGALPHATVLLAGSGQYLRDDSYGQFDAKFDDAYHFDEDTGFFVSETYSETDVGYYQNTAASFHLQATLTITSSSYSVPLDLLTFSLLYLGIPAAVVLLIVAAVRVRRGPSRLKVGTSEVRIRRARNAADVANLTPDGSPFFGPFLPLFADRSVAEGDPVVLALADRAIVGLALLDKESGMGSLFAADDRVARVLMKRVPMRDFFADATIPANLLQAHEMDRFAILQLVNPQPLEYDTSVVRPMAAQNLIPVTGIAQTTYRASAMRFIQSSFGAGDLGFVAVVDGRVVGFGFATVVGDVARLHTLTVDAPYRARGLGTQIMNARLSALAALGVKRVILEISKTNVASLRIASRAGFATIGETVYYSKVPAAAPAALQRQT